MARRFAFALVVLAVVVSAQWPNEPPPDFQVWVAADAVADKGGDPYDMHALNSELQSDPEYGRYWQEDPDQFVVRFFNPPMWLSMLQSVGFSAALMSFAGIGLLAGSITYLGRDVDQQTFAGYVIVGATIILSPMSRSTIAFGQTGFVLAGLIGLRLALLDRSTEGIPLALLSFKPHLALAAALPALCRRTDTLLRRLIPPALLLLGLTAALYGLSPFANWVEAVITDDGSIIPIDDMTLRTFSTRWPLPAHFSPITLLVAMVAVVVVSRRDKHVDPASLVLFSLALVAFMSGHGFVHDWLWIMLIPVVFGWTLARSLVGVVVIVGVHSATFAINLDPPYPVISSPSVVALLVLGYLSYELFFGDPEPVVRPQLATTSAEFTR